MRAEELIVEIYRQRSELVEEGQKPVRVVISAEHYKLVQAYRGQLGELASREVDYLDPYRIFDLEICVEEIETPNVQVSDPGINPVGSE